MTQNEKKVLIFSCVIFMFSIILVICYMCVSWIILPTKSTPAMLTIVDYSTSKLKQITMKHYVNDELVNKYVLELKIGVRSQTSQKYRIPEVREGMIEFEIKVDDGMIAGDESTFLTVKYNTNDLYKDGLLIYLSTIFNSAITINGLVYCDQYIYFISGKERIYFFEKAGESQWLHVSNAPKPKWLVRAEISYSPFYYGWKENKWIEVPVT